MKKWFEQLGITKSDFESNDEVVILKFLDETTSEPVIPLNDLFQGNHENQYYCGLCGWSDIRSFPHSH